MIERHDAVSFQSTATAPRLPLSRIATYGATEMVHPRSIAALIYFTAVASYCREVVAGERRSFAVSEPRLARQQQHQQQRRKIENQDVEATFLHRIFPVNSHGNSFVQHVRRAAPVKAEPKTQQATKQNPQVGAGDEEDTSGGDKDSHPYENEPPTQSEEGAYTLPEDLDQQYGDEEDEQNPSDEENGGNSEEGEAGDLEPHQSNDGTVVVGEPESESRAENNPEPAGNDGESQAGGVELVTSEELEPQGFMSESEHAPQMGGNDPAEDEEVGKVTPVEGHVIVDTSRVPEGEGFDSQNHDGTKPSQKPPETEEAQGKGQPNPGMDTEVVRTPEPGSTDDSFGDNDDGLNDEESIDTPSMGDSTDPETGTETSNKNDDVWNDDKVTKAGDSGSESIDESLVPNEIKVEERRVRFLSASGVIFAIFAMIFTAYQMSENPDGFYAAMCRFCITVIVCIFRIVLSPCKGVFGYSNKHSHYGHVPVSTLDYGYRDPSVELQLQ